MPSPLVFTCGHPCPASDQDSDALDRPCPLCRTTPETPSVRMDPPSTDDTASLPPSATILQPPPLDPWRSPLDYQITRELPIVSDSPQTGVEEEVTQIATPAYAGSSDPSAHAHSIHVDCPPGYELIRELGRGGMSVVYQARKLSDGQIVALKMIPGGTATTAVLQRRFLAEARVLARLKHPNIVRVLDVGEVRGQPYFSLEYVSGGPLNEYLRDDPHPADFAARLLVTLARAIQTAHELGIVHRDLKPANILVSGPDWASDRLESVRPEAVVKIADFGLAMNVIVEAERQRTGWIIGTPSYMAPEQAAGKPNLICRQTDIWALGVILYECLTGRPPFLGNTALETLRQVQEEEPIPLRRLRPGIPAALETICLKCLQKSTSKRYGTATELARDLERYLKRQPIHARPPGAWELFGRWRRQHPKIALALVGTGLALFVALVGAIVYLAGLQASYREVQEARQREETRNQQLVAKQGELEARESLLQQYRYAANIQQAQQLWAQGDLRAMEQVLQPYRTGSEQPLRDFACRHLEQLMVGSVLAFSGHKEDVYSLAWSPDGSQLVSGGKDGTLRFWNSEGEARPAVAAHANEINAVAFSADGKTVATGSDDGRIGLWDAHTGGLQAYLPSQGTPVVALAFGVNGQTLYSGTHDGRLTQWSITRVVQSRELAHIDGRVQQIELSPDGRWLAVAGGKDRATLIELTSDPRVFPLKLDNQKTLSVDFSPSGKHLAVGSDKGDIFLFDVALQTEIAQSTSQGDYVQAVAFTLDGSLLITGTQDGQLRLWDPRDLTPRGILPGHAGRVWCIVASPDGQWLASAGSDGLVKLRLPGRGEGFEPLGYKGPAIHALAEIPDVPLVALGTSAGVELFPLAGQERQSIARFDSPDPVLSLSVSPNRDCMLVGRAPELLYLQDFRTQTVRKLTRTYRDDLAMSFSSDGRIAASGDAKGHVKLWQMPAGTPLPSSINTESPITALAFVPGSNQLVLGTSAGLLSLWTLDGQTPVRKWSAHQTDILRVALNPQGNILASTGRDHAVRLWNLDTYTEIQHGLLGHHKPVADAVFSPDGKNLATAGEDATVRLWSVDTGRELLKFTLPGPAKGVAFLDADRLLVVGYDDKQAGYARIYRAVPE